MTKLLSVIIFILSISIALSATDCSAGVYLRSKYGLTSVSTPTFFNNTKYCKSLKNQAICCTADSINSFQQKSNDLTAKLSSIVAARDRYLIQVRGVIPELRNSIKAFRVQAELFFKHYGFPDFEVNYTDTTSNSTNTVVNSTKNKQMETPTVTATATATATPVATATPIATASSSSSGTVTTITNSSSSTNETEEVLDLDSISQLIYVLEIIAEVVVDNFGQLQANFTTYQKYRSGCIVEVVKLQNAAWCLACDPNLTSKGFNRANYDIAISDRVCDRLQSACYNFMTYSESQNMILTASYFRKVFVGFTSLIKALLTGDTKDLEAFGNTEAAEPSGPEQTPATMPDGCTEADCSWICSNMFSMGQIDQETLAAGGSIESDTTDSRLLLQDMVQKSRNGAAKQGSRILAGSNNFDPDSDESGTSVTFQDDPGNVNNGSAAVVKVGVISMMFFIFSIIIS